MMLLIPKRHLLILLNGGDLMRLVLDFLTLHENFLAFLFFKQISFFLFQFLFLYPHHNCGVFHLLGELLSEAAEK